MRYKFFLGFTTAALALAGIAAARMFDNPKTMFYCTVSTLRGYCVPVIKLCRPDISGPQCTFSFELNGVTYIQPVYTKAVFTHGGHALPCNTIGNCVHTVVYTME